MPPEIDPAYPRPESESEWFAFLPGTGEIDTRNNIVAVQPVSRILAVFSLQRNPSWWGRLGTAVRLVPGDYTIHVVCPYWTTLEDAQQRKPNYSTQIAEITLPVVAPQSAILFGAALGGLMAFVLLPTLWLPVSKKFEEHGWFGKTFIVVRGLGVSSLLSVMVTILLSRVSESQFLVRVSVQDFWGAIAIGFIVGVSGTSVLQRFNLSQARQMAQAQMGTPTNVTENELGRPGIAGVVKQTGTDSSTSTPKAA